MKVLKDLISSEKFVAASGAIALATVGAFTEALSWTDYYEFVKLLAGMYIGGKTIQGAAAAISNRSATKDIETMDKFADEINKRVDKLIEEKFNPQYKPQKVAQEAQAEREKE